MQGSLAKADDDFTPQDAYFLGRAVAANILSRYPLWKGSPSATQYLNEICAAIAVNSPMPDIYNGYHVGILDSSELNAFATMGGHIFVCRGLLDRLSNEDALAAVLAHEIAHIQLKHGEEIIKAMKLPQELSKIAEQSARAATRQAGLSERRMLFGNAVTNMITTLVQNGYSRDQEFQADAYALKLLANAGYSPASLVEVLALLQKSGSSGGYNGTHPAPAQRISKVQQDLPRYRVEDTRASRASRFAKKN
jgi:predicted Zn-dependent protease